jgi:hypothetical protein
MTLVKNPGSTSTRLTAESGIYTSGSGSAGKKDLGDARPVAIAALH